MSFNNNHSYSLLIPKVIVQQSGEPVTYEFIVSGSLTLDKRCAKA